VLPTSPRMFSPEHFFPMRGALWYPRVFCMLVSWEWRSAAKAGMTRYKVNLSDSRCHEQSLYFTWR